MKEIPLKYFRQILRSSHSLGIIWPMIKSYLPVACICFVLFLGTAGCEIINPEEDVPAFIRIDAMEVRSDFMNQTGTLDHNITDAWVFVDDNLLGTFELPAIIPSLQVGDVKVTVFAGIKDNGIAASRAIYPFYERYDIQTRLVRDSIVTLNPVVKHVSPDDVTYLWLEEFEDLAISLDSIVGNEVVLQRIEEEGEPNDYLGNFSLGMEIDETHQVMAIGSEAFELPRTGQEIYLEMNYKTAIRLEMGMQFYGEANGLIDQVFINLLPTVDENGELVWNKIYLELTELANLDPEAEVQRIVFGANEEVTGNTGMIFLDNIKLIHQK